MKRLLKMLFFVLIFALAACSPAASPSPVAEVAQEPTATVASTPTSESVPATPTQTTQLETQAIVKTPVPLGDPMPGCQTISFNPTPEPTLQALFPAPGPEDWKQGLDTAAVTIVEYGDFQ
jgi:hypothetical protein